MSLFLFAGCTPSVVSNLTVSGSGGVPVLEWRGPNAEIFNVDRDGALWFQLGPDDLSADCTNVLDGSDGVTWGQWPATYSTRSPGNLDTLVEVPATLPDGDYTIGVANCVENGTFNSYIQDAFIVFSVTNGEVTETP